MKTRNSMVLAATIASILSAPSFAADSYTGYAQVLDSNGNVTKTFYTYGVGEAPKTTIASKASTYLPPELFAAGNGTQEFIVDHEALLAMKHGDKVDLVLPGATHSVVHDSSITHDNGDVSWTGNIGDLGTAIITFGKYGSTYVTVTTGYESYHITTGSDGHSYAINPSLAGFGTTNGVDDQVATPSHSATTAAAQATTTLTPAQIAANVVNDNTAWLSLNAYNPKSTVIDVLIAYEPGLATSYAIPTLINTYVATTNKALADSGLSNVTIRVVNSLAVTYTGAGDNGSALTALANSTNGFTSIASLRTTYGADNVVFLRQFNTKTQGLSCGLSYVNGAYGSALSANLAYSVVGVGVDVNTRAYLCGANTFPHELGHAWGLVHNFENSAGAGAFKFAYGYEYIYKGVATWGDIMSYAPSVILKFSNPNIEYTIDSATGTKILLGIANQADTARAISLTAPVVANFKTAAAAAKVATIK